MKIKTIRYWADDAHTRMLVFRCKIENDTDEEKISDEIQNFIKQINIDDYFLTKEEEQKELERKKKEYEKDNNIKEIRNILKNLLDGRFPE